MQLKFTNYDRSGNKNVCQGACKFPIIGKWKICWVWDNGQDFCNFEELLCQVCHVMQKHESVVEKGVFALNKFFLS